VEFLELLLESAGFCDILGRLRVIGVERERLLPAEDRFVELLAQSGRTLARAHFCHVSRVPPKIPDGRFSRIRFQTMAFLPVTFPSFPLRLYVGALTPGEIIVCSGPRLNALGPPG